MFIATNFNLIKNVNGGRIRISREELWSFIRRGAQIRQVKKAPFSKNKLLVKFEGVEKWFTVEYYDALDMEIDYEKLIELSKRKF